MIQGTINLYGNGLTFLGVWSANEGRSLSNISKAARGGQYKLGRAWVVFADAFARALVGKYGKKWVAFLHA